MIVKLFPSNLHTHTNYCDGRNTAEEYIEAAIEKGFLSIGFSGHSYLPFDEGYCLSPAGTVEYCRHILSLKEKYRGKIEVYLGIETDYFSNLGIREAEKMKLDYRIGSVHYISDKDCSKYYCIDNKIEQINEGIQDIAGGDARIFVEKYYDTIEKMILEQQPEIIGHLDLIKKLNHNNLFFNEEESWYKEVLDKVTSTIALSGSIVEVNTGGIARGYTSFPYPSRFILEMIKEKNIPITLNSDAHQVSHLDYHFFEAIDCIQKIGINTLKILKGGQFENFEL